MAFNPRASIMRREREIEAGTSYSVEVNDSGQEILLRERRCFWAVPTLV